MQRVVTIFHAEEERVKSKDIIDRLLDAMPAR